MRLTVAAAVADVTERRGAGGLLLPWSGPPQYLQVHQELVSFSPAHCRVRYCHTGQSSLSPVDTCCYFSL